MGRPFNIIRIVAFYSILLVAVSSFSPDNDKGAPNREPTTHVIAIRDFRYVPESLTVAASDKIVWKNEDMAPHTATAQGAFDSGNIPYAGEWTFVADRKGTFTYICTLHPKMKATLIVQ